MECVRKGCENIEHIVDKLYKAGCPIAFVEDYIQMSLVQDQASILQVFEQYMQELQASIAQEGKLIDCIDYLIYEIECK